MKKKKTDNLETGKITGEAVENFMKKLDKLQPKGSYPEWVLINKDQYKELKKFMKNKKSILI